MGFCHLGLGRFILAQVRPGPEKNGPNSTHRDEFRLRPSLARPGPGLIEGHFWGLAHRGPGRFILAQVRPGPGKNGPNSTHRDEFRLRPGLAQPGPGLIEGHFWGLAHHGPGRAGPGPSSARAGKKRPKLIPSSIVGACSNDLFLCQQLAVNWKLGSTC